jgi:hypothetical protein
MIGPCPCLSMGQEYAHDHRGRLCGRNTELTGAVTQHTAVLRSNERNGGKPLEER